MGNRFIFTLAVAVAVTAVAGLAAAEGLTFETTVPYRVGKELELGGKVGPVTVRSVTFSESESGHVGSTIMGKLRRGDEGLQGVIKLAFAGENPTKEEWEVSFVIELLDRDGKTIDRFERSTDFQGEAKTYDTEHAILRYVMPLIHKVKIGMSAKLD